jgi:hypothetical protein
MRGSAEGNCTQWSQIRQSRASNDEEIRESVRIRLIRGREESVFPVPARGVPQEEV